MTRDETSAGPQQDRRSEPQHDHQDDETSTSVRRGSFVILDIEDPRRLAAALRFLDDILIRPGSTLAATMRDLAEQLEDPDTLKNQAQAALTARVDRAWHEQIEETVRHSGYRWSLNKFRDEWDSYIDPTTGQPHPLPYRWDRRVDRLEAEGLPWRIVRDEIHDSLTLPSRRHTFDAFVRGCRRHLARTRERTERHLGIVRT